MRKTLQKQKTIILLFVTALSLLLTIIFSVAQTIPLVHADMPSIAPNTPIPIAFYGEEFSFQLRDIVEGGSVLQWSLHQSHIATSELPDSLSIDADTGEIYGIPQEIGSFRFYVEMRFGQNNMNVSGGLTLTVEHRAVASIARLQQRTANSIVIYPVTDFANGQVAEFAIATSNAAPTSDSLWQLSNEFLRLESGTIYYVFVRPRANDTHPAGVPSTGLQVITRGGINPRTIILIVSGALALIATGFMVWYLVKKRGKGKQ